MNKLTIYLHVPKTGGSTIFRHIQINYKKEEILHINAEKLNLGFFDTRRSLNDYCENIIKFIEKIPNRRKAKIKIVYGHLIPYGIERMFVKKARYITSVRNPEERIISLYNYYKTSINMDKRNYQTKAFKSKYLLDQKEPDFAEWLKYKFALKTSTIENTNYQQYFESLGYLDKSEANYQNLVSKFDFVGISEKSYEDFLYIYNLLSIKKYLINQNVSFKFKKGLNLNEKKLLKTKLGDDYLIYQEFYKKNLLYKEKHKDFDNLVSKVRNKRFLLIGFHQIRYDLGQYLKVNSAKIRWRVPLYGLILDKIKKYLKKDSLIST